MKMQRRGGEEVKNDELETGILSPLHQRKRHHLIIVHKKTAAPFRARRFMQLEASGASRR